MRRALCAVERLLQVAPRERPLRADGDALIDELAAQARWRSSSGSDGGADAALVLVDIKRLAKSVLRRLRGNGAPLSDALGELGLARRGRGDDSCHCCAAAVDRHLLKAALERRRALAKRKQTAAQRTVGNVLRAQQSQIKPKSSSAAKHKRTSVVICLVTRLGDSRKNEPANAVVVVEVVGATVAAVANAPRSSALERASRRALTVVVAPLGGFWRAIEIGAARGPLGSGRCWPICC